MPSFGGYAPFPLRFGGGKPPLEHRVKSLLSQLGSAYDNDTTSLVYIRAQAFGRVFWALWEQNTRLANQWDPSRMTDFLGRWESILRLPVAPEDSLSTRRARVAVAFARDGEATEAVIHDTAVSYLTSSVFVSVVTTASGSAQVWTPSGWPMGNHPVLSTDPDWYSSVAHVDIMTTQPATMPDSEHYALRGSLVAALDSILPAWVTLDVLKDGAGGAIFRLDDTSNLDNERFGS